MCAAFCAPGSILWANPVTPMKANVGSYDAAVRFTVGCVVLGLGVHHETWWGLVGLAPLLTAIAAFCPLYVPFHIDTTFTDRPHSHHGPE